MSGLILVTADMTAASLSRGRIFFGHLSETAATGEKYLDRARSFLSNISCHGSLGNIFYCTHYSASFYCESKAKYCPEN